MKNMVIFPSLNDDEYEPKVIFPIQKFSQYHLLIAFKAEKITQEKCWLEFSCKSEAGKVSLLNLMHKYLDVEASDFKRIIITDCKNLFERAKTFPNSFIVLNKRNLLEALNNQKLLDFLLLKNIRFLTIMKGEIAIINHPFFQEKRIYNLI